MEPMMRAESSRQLMNIYNSWLALNEYSSA